MNILNLFKHNLPQKHNPVLFSKPLHSTIRHNFLSYPHPSTTTNQNPHQEHNLDPSLILPACLILICNNFKHLPLVAQNPDDTSSLSEPHKLTEHNRMKQNMLNLSLPVSDPFIAFFLLECFKGELQKQFRLMFHLSGKTRQRCISFNEELFRLHQFVLNRLIPLVVQGTLCLRLSQVDIQLLDLSYDVCIVEFGDVFCVYFQTRNCLCFELTKLEHQILLLLFLNTQLGQQGLLLLFLLLILSLSR